MLQQWLAEQIWPLGRSVNAEELVQRVSGRPLEAQPFLRHLGRAPAAGEPEGWAQGWAATRSHRLVPGTMGPLPAPLRRASRR